jgi:hypothetical protein
VPNRDADLSRIVRAAAADGLPEAQVDALVAAYDRQSGATTPATATGIGPDWRTAMGTPEFLKGQQQGFPSGRTMGAVLGFAGGVPGVAVGSAVGKTFDKAIHNEPVMTAESGMDTATSAGMDAALSAVPGVLSWGYNKLGGIPSAIGNALARGGLGYVTGKGHLGAAKAALSPHGSEGRMIAAIRGGEHVAAPEVQAVKNVNAFPTRSESLSALRRAEAEAMDTTPMRPSTSSPSPAAQSARSAEQTATSSGADDARQAILNQWLGDDYLRLARMLNRTPLEEQRFQQLSKVMRTINPDTGHMFDALGSKANHLKTQTAQPGVIGR